jgi:hypothetical protein
LNAMLGDVNCQNVLANHGHADLDRRYRRRVASIRLGNY